MGGVQINEELLANSAYFAAEDRRAELGAIFKFDQRRVILGEGALAGLAEECVRLGAGRVLLIHDPGIPALTEQVRSALSDLAVVGSYSEIAPNPSVASVDDCARVLAAAEFEVVVALGGGSTMDTAKSALCVAACGGSVRDYFGFDLFEKPPRAPLIGIPTTAGTGSEASRVTVVADETGKQALYSDYLQPKVALVDPLLHRDLPPVLTAITGLDALGHALECTASQKSNEIGDAVARVALAAGCPAYEQAVAGGAAEARYQMARCALLAGLLLSPINTGAGHALGYGIEKVSFERGKPVPHGTAVALVLPGVMRHNAPAVADKYYFAAGAAGLELGGKSREEGVELMAGWIDGLRRRHTPYGSLANAELGAEDIPRMIEIAMGVRRLLDPNPVAVAEDDAAAIYRGVLA
ncbi:MAG: iron-containing alcohol dehydrogenase [Candidatus Latescibacterota bacterium]|nr:iron-containing alcohol dehydrogenase [Candidatus Latescibacterota bacterium]